jgi:hypothetical protein
MSRLGFTAALAFLISGAAAAGSADHPATVRDELARLLIEDSKMVPGREKAATPKLSGSQKSDGSKHSGSTEQYADPPQVSIWTHFTDTGILSSFHGKNVTGQVTFGPCTDGELLNQRFFW